MNEILNGMKILKLYAWEDSFQEQVSSTRELEVIFPFRITFHMNNFSAFLCKDKAVSVDS